MYKIQQDKVLPYVQWNINPPAEKTDILNIKANGFIGDYLFVHYRRNDMHYIYLENMKTGKKYNVSNIVDDIYHTSGACEIHSMNQKGSFFFIKDRSDIKGNNVENVPVKNGPVLFMIKTK